MAVDHPRGTIMTGQPNTELPRTLLATEPPPSSSQSVILLVEDDEALRRVQQRALLRAGFQVVASADGHGAVDALRTNTFDLVLSDIELPRMDGLGVLEQVREFDLDVPGILMAGR